MKNQFDCHVSIQEDFRLCILIEYGFQNVKTAKNVKEAMEQAEKSRPELAILDNDRRCLYGLHYHNRAVNKKIQILCCC